LLLLLLLGERAISVEVRLSPCSVVEGGRAGNLRPPEEAVVDPMETESLRVISGEVLLTLSELPDKGRGGNFLPEGGDDEGTAAVLLFFSPPMTLPTEL